MDKELENLLDNYENVIYGQTFPINPLIHQLHLLLDYIANLEQKCKKQKEVIDKAINFIENGDLLYLATKNSLVYRNNVEVRAVADRLNDLLQILEDKEVSK